jgi:hypothetical protein
MADLCNRSLFISRGKTEKALTQPVDVIYHWKACSVPYTAVIAVSILLHSSSVEKATKQRVNAVLRSIINLYFKGRKHW